MDAILELLNLDISHVIIGIFMILSAIVAIAAIIGKFSEIAGKPVKWIKNKNTDHELLLQTIQGLKSLQDNHEESVRQSIRHDEMIKNDIAALTETVNGIVVTLSEMQEKENETKRKELKDFLIRYYNKYKAIGEWSKLESDAFWDLFADYEKRGGDGFIHTIVEPAMRELKETD